MRIVLPVAALIAVSGCAHAPPAPPSIACDSCAEWNAPRAPFRVFGETYFVGPAGLGSVLVTSPAGHVLLDGGLPQSAPGIIASVRKLGFRIEDVKVLVASHTHFDHVGGLAALARASGAQVIASRAAARALAEGAPGEDDPQPGTARFPPVRVDRIIDEGDVVEVGALRMTAHTTPGHTPGGTTWSWRSCEGTRCLDVVYADSLNAISDEGFRYTAQPDRAETFAQSIDKVADLPCDILLPVHPGFARLDEKLAARAAGKVDAFVDCGACSAYADEARRKLAQRLAEERKTPAR